eukprot:TRINITY_DN9311_c0_g1_i1.p1 TRINITY_DN9311_c0_g1~~TRINITY_DN9311_c0_g1_i1.p1  ORF type:complete len:178 (+),score=35.56 TRINITY_DN9311_c0_g1_i1:64-597(+)
MCIRDRYMGIMDFLEIFNVELEWYFRYALIISNFVLITVLLIFRGRRQGTTDEPRKNVLILIAHPDDETMFFIPTITSLKADYNLFLYCTTNGDYDGLGKVREKELEQVGKYLGFSDVHILGDPEIKDGPNEKWDLNRLEVKLKDYIAQKNIEGVLTFDNYGVSGHSNHGALYHLAV